MTKIAPRLLSKKFAPRYLRMRFKWTSIKNVKKKVKIKNKWKCEGVTERLSRSCGPEAATGSKGQPRVGIKSTKCLTQLRGTGLKVPLPSTCYTRWPFPQSPIAPVTRGQCYKLLGFKPNFGGFQRVLLLSSWDEMRELEIWDLRMRETTTQTQHRPNKFENG